MEMMVTPLQSQPKKSKDKKFWLILGEAAVGEFHYYSLAVRSLKSVREVGKIYKLPLLFSMASPNPALDF